jgi:shikimate dehydrogenase
MPSADAVLTLDDLAVWPRAQPSLAVLGQPIKQSVSPAMHNAALAEFAARDARFSDWKYFRFEVPPARLPEALGVFWEKGFVGLNLTVPHKVIAFTHLGLEKTGDGSPRHVIERAAQPIGAVNTLHRTKTGWHAHNTDSHGLATAVQETLGRELTGVPVILLGAGGAARGAAVECLLRKCAALWIGNRTPLNRDALLIDLAPAAGEIPLRGFDPQNPPAALPGDALVINATSAGLREGDAAPFDLRALKSAPLGVYDMIVRETPLLAQARALGFPAADGLSMLVHQGARALTIWTGLEAPVETMRAAARKALG